MISHASEEAIREQQAMLKPATAPRCGWRTLGQQAASLEIDARSPAASERQCREYHAHLAKLVAIALREMDRIYPPTIEESHALRDAG